MNPPLTWSLGHAWTSPSDLAALDLCRVELGSHGIDFQAAPPSGPAARKLHGMQLAVAARERPPGLQDLRDVAESCGWALRVPSAMRGYMRHGDRWHGIPMAIHRGNSVWVNRGVAARLGHRPPRGAKALFDWLESARAFAPAPLALGAEPWQVGVVFESLVLAIGGPRLYRHAFVDPRPGAWVWPRLREVLEALGRLRRFVDEAALGLPWDGQLGLVAQGRAAIQFMGDWARCGGHPPGAVLEWSSPGTADHFVAVMDFFAPLRGAHEPANRIAARALTAAPFQVAFARAKGCMPAMADAWDAVDGARASMLRRDARVLPSWVFDQCGCEGRKQRWLDMLRRHFVDPRPARATAELLKECVADPHGKGLP